MNSIQSCTDYSDFIKIINTNYPVGIDQIHLHRNVVGYVYFAENRSRKYVLKLHRSFESENALRAIQIIQYLKHHDYPVVSIVPTISDTAHIIIDTPQGPSVAVLYEYADGTEPALTSEIEKIGKQVGWLHRLMNAYPEPLICRGKDFGSC